MTVERNHHYDDDILHAATVANNLAQVQSCTLQKTIDADTYNLDAFDQCEGAWPIGHPLPLPMWSNQSKAPLIVDKVGPYLL